MGIAAETATIYRASNGRRYLTKKAAVINDAMHRLKRKHEKAGCRDWLEGGEHRQEVFYTDEQWGWMCEAARRYYRRFGRKQRTKGTSTNE